MNKPGIPKGTRDFSPKEMSRRNYIFDTIRFVYAQYGFQQIETPAMETMQTLMGKYGEEGDKLLFRVLDSGNFIANASDEELLQRNSMRLAARFCEKGLRYDLTVPLARYVVMHRNELQLPFRRYQIQPVWRADRPQKGRYREFYQCDADIVGSDSLLNEVELLQIVDDVFSMLGVRVQIRINNRKILAGIADVIGSSVSLVDITVAIDKLDKIGLEGVEKELRADGMSDDIINQLHPLLTLSGSNADKLNTLSQLFGSSSVGQTGIEETRYILSRLAAIGLSNDVIFDLTLARGLNYYTGAIFEVKALDVTIGSITGGGRYDNLTGIFGMPGVSGVGISFGADRIYDILNQLNLYPQRGMASTKVLIINFGESTLSYGMGIAKTLRHAGVCVEIYPDAVKVKKQMSYANAMSIPFVVIAGDKEMISNRYALKNMLTGEQYLLSDKEVVERVKATTVT